MTFKPRFFYEAGDANEGGGNPADTLEGNPPADQNQQQPPADIPKPFISEEEAKTFGFDSPDALKTFLAERQAKAAEASITPEQRQEQENIEKANLLKFAAENKLLTVDDYTEYETLKAKSDKDLVFQNFKKEFAVDNPEITDAQELEEAAQEEFNYVNKLSDPKSAEKAEKKWAKEAKELRNPIESKVTAAQTQYKESETIKQAYPKFDKFVDELIAKNTPNKLSVAVKTKTGDTETQIPIDVPLTEDDIKEMRESMSKSFKTPKAFKTFVDSKPEEAQKILDKKMQGWVLENKREAVLAEVFNKGEGVGRASGSNVGATNPFALVNNNRQEMSGDETLEESNAKLAKVRNQYQNTH